MKNKGKANSLLISLDIIGFVLIFIGAALIRYTANDIYSILGGFVMAGGVTVLSLSRLIPK
jgi:uncharacterized membrane protein